MAKTYRFRSGSRIAGVKAGDAAAELERLRRERGGLTPEAVVEEAAAPDNPLHPAFEWDEAAAAHQHRLSQARGLIRAVVVVEEGKPDAQMFVHVTFGDDRQYHPTAVVATTPSLFAAAMAELQGHLRAAQKAVADLRRLAPGDERPAAVERVLAEAADAAGEMSRAA